MFGKRMIAGHSEAKGHRADSKVVLPRFPHLSQPIFFVDTSGDSTTPGTGPLST